LDLDLLRFVFRNFALRDSWCCGETVWELYFGVGNEGPRRVSLSLSTSHFTPRD
jgi:hypothetical protein